MLSLTKPAKFFLKRLITSASPAYYLTNRYIKRTENYTSDQFRDFQIRTLGQILMNAYENVPYYRALFKAIQFHPNDFRQLSDIQRLPLLDKDIYRKNINSIVSKRVLKRFLPTVYTGGTTGTPLMLYRSTSDYGRERAFTEYAYKMVEMDHSVKTVYMRGKVNDENGQFSMVSDFGKKLYLSSHSMTDDQLGNYVDLIRSFRPKLFYTLPSVGAVFADYLVRKSIAPFESIKWFFCPSENLYDFQSEIIEKAFNCRIGTFYGHAEHAVIAVKCSHSSLYHVLPQYGYFELIDEKGGVIEEVGQRGEIVGTAFTNQVSPLIRYRTGDYAVYSEHSCPCGRHYQMIEGLSGREQSVAYDKNGAHINIGPELLCTIHDQSFKKLKQFKIEQHKVGELTFFIEPHDMTCFDDLKDQFEHFFNGLYPNQFKTSINPLVFDSITAGSDKKLYFVQHIKPNP